MGKSWKENPGKWKHNKHFQKKSRKQKQGKPQPEIGNLSDYSCGSNINDLNDYSCGNNA